MSSRQREQRIAGGVAEVVGVAGAMLFLACVGLFGAEVQETPVWPAVFYLDAALLQLLPMFGGVWFSFQFEHQRRPVRALILWCVASVATMGVGVLTIIRAFAATTTNVTH